MTATPPRWGEPIRYRHGAYEIGQLPLPQRQGIFCALALGILDNVEKSYGRPTLLSRSTPSPTPCAWHKICRAL